ncbi:hypothetical protein [Aquimarina sp. AU119]|uniref:hypothetical protein n=1 Tax=Aquimarina sp. AU119 TaxID=2108528 RepID=UPI000D687A6D|nr:hypothetical protein [Aquimarina sp. AU119]
MDKLYNIILFAFISLNLSCQDEKKVEINEEWLNKDVIFFNEIKNLLKNDPNKIERLIPRRKKGKPYELGDNFILESGSKGYGYISVFYDYVIKEDSLYSYRLLFSKDDYSFAVKNTDLNIDKMFPIRDDRGYAFFYNIENTIKPFNKDTLDFELTNEFEFLLTPFSGIYYGCRGGFGNPILENRNIFNIVSRQSNITKKQLLMMMNSINPATMLTGIEYYKRNIDLFKDEEIELRIDQIYNEVPFVPILYSDQMSFIESKKSVEHIIENDCI